MSKTPAFQFYPQDFMVGTAHMTLEEVGAYITLLCVAWETNGLPVEEGRIARVLRASAEEFNRVWPTLKSKWEQRGDRLVNPRQEEVRDSLAAFHERAQKGGEARAASAGRKADGSFAPAKEPADNPAAVQLVDQPDTRSSSASSSSTSSDPSSTTAEKVSLVPTSPLLQTVVGRFRQAEKNRKPIEVDEAAVARTLHDFQHVHNLPTVAANCAEWMANTTKGRTRKNAAATLRSFLKNEPEKPPGNLGQTGGATDPVEGVLSNYSRRLGRTEAELRPVVAGLFAKTGSTPLLHEVHKALEAA